tara:strand:+ start:2724 stop:3188 length:465 start_codon:yes stop_codon:yes gene_type:complete
MLITYIHLLTLVVWFGGMIFFSFIAAPSIFSILPKEKAGDVVGDIFPKYFLIGYISSLLLLGTLLWLGRGQFKTVLAPLSIIVIMTCLTFYSGLIIGSKARNIKQEIRQTPEETKKEDLRKDFKKIHGVSMMLNISVIILSLAYLTFIPKILRL